MPNTKLLRLCRPEKKPGKSRAISKRQRDLQARRHETGDRQPEKSEGEVYQTLPAQDRAGDLVDVLVAPHRILDAGLPGEGCEIAVAELDFDGPRGRRSHGGARVLSLACAGALRAVCRQEMSGAPAPPIHLPCVKVCPPGAQWFFGRQLKQPLHGGRVR